MSGHKYKEDDEVAFYQFCKHYTGSLTCKAYEERIPKRIYMDEVKHDQVLDDQKGDFIFMARDDVVIKKL